jgi:uncharacterized protein (TIGR03435 family)
LIGPGGPKLKEAAPSAGPQDKPFPNGPAGRKLVRLIQREDGGMWTVSFLEGQMLFEAAKISMPELALFLIPYAGAPVIDLTALKGDYEVALVLPPNTANAGTFIGMRGGLATGDPQRASEPSGVSIFQTVQSLGLKLERRKAPVARLVIDHLDKTPTEN